MEQVVQPARRTFEDVVENTLRLYRLHDEDLGKHEDIDCLTVDDVKDLLLQELDKSATKEGE